MYNSNWKPTRSFHRCGEEKQATPDAGRSVGKWSWPRATWTSLLHCAIRQLIWGMKFPNCNVYSYTPTCTQVC